MPIPEYFASLEGKHITIVAFGDSITATTHWTHGAMNWVQLLEQNIGTVFRKGATVINSGVGGDNVPKGMARLEWDVLRFQPDIVIVSFGANDAKCCDLEEFRAQYQEMLSKIREQGALIVTRTPTPFINLNDGTELYEMPDLGKIVPYNVEGCADVVRELSKEMGILCIDHYASWKKSLQSIYHGEMMLMMGNSIHPNGEGHRRMYYELAPYFGLSEYFQNDFKNILIEEGRI